MLELAERPDTKPQRPQRQRRREHLPFAVLLAAGLVARVAAMVAVKPIMISDSYDYVAHALRVTPFVIRPNGYAFFLWALKPFHSFALVVAVQHAMGLAVAVMVYALLRRKGLPGWAGCLAVTPVLFSVHQLRLENAILSEVLFELLVVAAVVLVLWSRTASAAAGLLLAGAALTRTVGVPLVVILLGCLAVTRQGWRTVTAAGLAAAVPLVGYALWFHAYHGSYALSGRNGTFLYGRVMEFADCAKMRPPPPESLLCTDEPPASRLRGDAYIGGAGFPLDRLHRGDSDAVAGRFALRAIRTQPLDFARTALRDFAAFFAEPWVRLLAPPEESGRWHAKAHTDAVRDVSGYEKGDLLVRTAKAQMSAAPPARTRDLQRYEGYLLGAVLGVVLIVGLAGIVARRGGPAVLPWLTAVAILAIPAATAVFDRRYMVPAVPLAFLAAAISRRT